MRVLSIGFALGAVALGTTGCDDAVVAGSTCTSTSECASGSTCVAYGSGAGTCLVDCSVSANACGGTAQCSGAGSASIDVCQEPAKATNADNPPKEETQPRIPCTTDAECGAIATGGICVQWRGVRDCSFACSVEDDCTPPALAGTTVDFLTCKPDEGDTTRNACVPDEACWTSPQSCVKFGSPF